MWGIWKAFIVLNQFTSYVIIIKSQEEDHQSPI